jgi:hypothetical protein
MKLHVSVSSIGSIQTFEKSTFKKQELLGKTVENQMPVKLEFTGNSIDLLKDVLIGQELIVEYNLRGHEFDNKDKSGKYLGKDIINSLVAYKLTIV